MFVVLCYDVGIKRNARVKKTVRRFLRPVQRSVCEGFITQGKLNKLCDLLKTKIDPDEDAVVIYKLNIYPDFEKMTIGTSRKNEDFIL